MIKDGLNVNVFDIDYFFQWGTPRITKNFFTAWMKLIV